jgi:hypothetical protein
LPSSQPRGATEEARSEREPGILKVKRRDGQVLGRCGTVGCRGTTTHGMTWPGQRESRLPPLRTSEEAARGRARPVRTSWPDKRADGAPAAVANGSRASCQVAERRCGVAASRSRARRTTCILMKRAASAAARRHQAASAAARRQRAPNAAARRPPAAPPTLFRRQRRRRSSATAPSRGGASLRCAASQRRAPAPPHTTTFRSSSLRGPRWTSSRPRRTPCP